MTHSQIIELMARAIIQAYSPRSHPDAWKAWEQHAIAAYDALTAAGLAILPIEPSADDIDVIAYALAKACADFYGDRFPETFDMTLSRCLAKAAHDAMIAAAMKERGE